MTQSRPHADVIRAFADAERQATIEEIARMQNIEVRVLEHQLKQLTNIG